MYHLKPQIQIVNLSMLWRPLPSCLIMLYLYCFIVHFVLCKCNLNSLFKQDKMEVFGQIVPIMTSGYRWLNPFKSRSELRLSFPKQSISFLLYEPVDHYQVSLESLFTARGFSMHDELKIQKESDFSLRSGHQFGNKTIRITGFILDGIFSGFAGGDAADEEISVRAKFANFLSKGQTYIIARRKVNLFDGTKFSNFCRAQAFAGNFSGKSFSFGMPTEFLSQ